MLVAPETLLGLLRFLTFGLLALLVALWLVVIMAPKHCAGWGFAACFPLVALSGGAAFAALMALPVATSPSDGMGGGFGKFGAIVIVTYSAPAWIVLLVSAFRFPRRSADYRLPSVLVGIGLLVGFLFLAYSFYKFPRISSARGGVELHVVDGPEESLHRARLGDADELRFRRREVDRGEGGGAFACGDGLAPRLAVGG